MKTLSVLSLAALLATGAANVSLAAANNAGEGTSSQSTANMPATGGGATMPYGSTGSAMTGQTYPGQVGPTGSTQPDATNPSRSAERMGAGGGHDSSGGGSGGTTGSR
jgi:hypothetical protein